MLFAGAIKIRVAAVTPSRIRIRSKGPSRRTILLTRLDEHGGVGTDRLGLRTCPAPTDAIATGPMSASATFPLSRSAKFPASRELPGNFVRPSFRRPPFGGNPAMNPIVCKIIPCATEQGIISVEQGIKSSHQGTLLSYIRVLRSESQPA